MTPVLYLIVDGMTESHGDQTSLAKARTPNIDAVLRWGTGGFYAPVVAAWDDEPKTDVVVPAFFGLSPDNNPGRATLELADLGHAVSQGTSSFFVTANLTEGQAAAFREFMVASDAEDRIQTAAERVGALAVQSIAYNYGRRWVVGNCPTADVHALGNELQRIIQHDAIVQDARAVPTGFLQLAKTCPDVCFLGWAKGALRGAFAHLGAECNPFNRLEGVYADWAALAQDFETRGREMLRRRKANASNVILYTKETAFASRRGDALNKIAGIEFMDSLLAEIVCAMDQEVVVVVISDHSCDIGGTRNPPERTSFAIARMTPESFVGDASEHFSEVVVSRLCGGKAILQSTLMDLIDDLRH